MMINSLNSGGSNWTTGLKGRISSRLSEAIVGVSVAGTVLAAEDSGVKHQHVYKLSKGQDYYEGF